MRITGCRNEEYDWGKTRWNRICSLNNGLNKEVSYYLINRTLAIAIGLPAVRMQVWLDYVDSCCVSSDLELLRKTRSTYKYITRNTSSGTYQRLVINTDSGWNNGLKRVWLLDEITKSTMDTNGTILTVLNIYILCMQKHIKEKGIVFC